MKPLPKDLQNFVEAEIGEYADWGNEGYFIQSATALYNHLLSLGAAFDYGAMDAELYKYFERPADNRELLVCKHIARWQHQQSAVQIAALKLRVEKLETEFADLESENTTLKFLNQEHTYNESCLLKELQESAQRHAIGADREEKLIMKTKTHANWWQLAQLLAELEAKFAELQELNRDYKKSEQDAWRYVQIEQNKNIQLREKIVAQEPYIIASANKDDGVLFGHLVTEIEELLEHRELAHKETLKIIERLGRVAADNKRLRDALKEIEAGTDEPNLTANLALSYDDESYS